MLVGLVAPTLDYRDWRDPELVRQDGLDLLPSLKALLDDTFRGIVLNNLA